MELNIVEPQSLEFHKALGISDERADELGASMDKLVKGYQGQIVRTHDSFNEIAHLCNNIEELVFCTISHTNFLAIRYGHFLCPPKSKE